jgi:uncharacterized membrane protein
MSMLAKYGIAYLSTGVAFAALDALWLSRMGPTFYRSQIGDLMADKPRFDAAIAFYLLYLAAIVFFAVAPAFAHQGGWKTAAGYGAAFGFFAYATYDLTNQATLKVWPLKLTLVDMAWGTVLTGVAATVGYLVTRVLVK